MIQFDCPRCAFELQLPDRRAGTIIRCPECEERLRVPSAGTAVPDPEVDGLQPIVSQGSGSRLGSSVVAVLAMLPLAGVIAVVALGGFLLKPADAPGPVGPDGLLPSEAAVPAIVSAGPTSSVTAVSVDPVSVAP
jgi:hypothetical protein